MQVKRAMILYIGRKGCNLPKSVLVSTDEEYGKRFDETAKEAFEKYKAAQQNNDIYLISYSYEGDVEIFDHAKE